MARSGSSRYRNLSRELIKDILGFEEYDKNFEKSLHYVLTNLQHHHCLDVNSHSVQRSLEGLAFKMGIHGHQNKAEKLLALTENFIASKIEQEIDVKWSILSLLVDIAEHPARDALCPTLVENLVVPTSDEQPNPDIDWIIELMEKSIQVPDKDETLSEWSDDEEIKRSLMIGSECEDFKNSCAAVNYVDSNEEKEKNISIQDANLAKCWLKNNIQPNYWGSKERVTKDYYFGEQVSESNVLTEYMVMRECLWILLCPTNGFIFTRDQCGLFEVKEVSLSSVSSANLKYLLQKFALAASHLNAIDEWLENVPKLDKCKSCETGTLQAYSDGLQSWRHLFNTEIVKLEEQVIAQEGHETLLWLFKSLELSIQDLSIIYKIHFTTLINSSDDNIEKKSLHLISVLITSIDSHISIKNRECLLKLLQFGLRHYLSQLQGFLWNRTVLESSLKLFGITCVRNDEEEKIHHRKQYFCDNSIMKNFLGLSFIQRICPSLIKICQLKGIMGQLQVPLDGDCINLVDLVNLGIQKAFSTPLNATENATAISISTPDSEQEEKGASSLDIMYPDPFLKIAFEEDEGKSLAGENKQEFSSTKIIETANVEQVLVKVLSPIVEKRYQQLSTGFMTLLKEEHNLQLKLSMLKAITLMEVGDSMHEFYSYLFGKVDDKECIDEASITLHIQYCIGLAYSTSADKFSISFNGLCLTKDQVVANEYFNTILSSMTIHYESTWPVSLIITDTVIEKYNKLFIFCLMLKRAIFTLERLHFKEIASYSSCYSNQNEMFHEGSSFTEESISFTSEISEEISEEELSLPHRQHRLHLLRQWLIFLASNLHNHFYTAILMPLSHKVDHLLESEKHFESFVKEHLLLLDDACRHCLLKDGCLSPVQSALSKVFSTIEAVKILWRGPPDKITSKQLIKLEEEYASYHRFLANFFSTLSRSHSSPHVEGLALSLLDSCPA